MKLKLINFICAKYNTYGKYTGWRRLDQYGSYVLW
jgi:hypothetical protein